MSVALIVGSASCLAADFAALQDVGSTWNLPTIACNDQIALWPYPIAHGVTQHPERMNRWRELRTHAGYNEDYETWTVEGESTKGARIDRILDRPWHDVHSWGSSAIIAVQVALRCYGKAVLVGVPMEPQPRVEGGTGQQWTEHDAKLFRGVWEKHKADMVGKVKSMSGWTEREFGKPTREWLEQA